MRLDQRKRIRLASIKTEYRLEGTPKSHVSSAAQLTKPTSVKTKKLEWLSFSSKTPHFIRVVERGGGGGGAPPPQYFGQNDGHTHSYNRIHTVIDL